MNYTVSVIFNDQLFRLTLPEGKRAEISASALANSVSPEFGHVVVIIAENGTIRISDTEEKGAEKVFTMRLNYPQVLDETRRIAVCVSEEMCCESTALLSESFSISLGRAAEGKNGRKNDVVLSSLPFVSRTQFEIVRENGKTTLTDLNSTNGTFVNGRRVKTAELHRGDEISILTARILYEKEYLRFENIVAEPGLADSLRWSPQIENLGTELFKRSPRIRLELPKDTVEISAPPPKGEKPEINWFSTILPVFATLSIAIIMATVMSNAMMMAYTLPMTITGLIVSIYNYNKQTKKYNEHITKTTERYNNYLAEKISEIEEKQSQQRRAMIWTNPDVRDCITIAIRKESRLWERTPTDTDYLDIRIGHGSVPSHIQIEVPKTNEFEDVDELKSKPKQIYEKYRTIADLPIVCNLLSDGIWGVVGTSEDNLAFLQNIVVEVTTLHSYTEVQIICVCDKTQIKDLKWLKNLPHVKSGAYGICFAEDKQSANDLFDKYVEVLKKRSSLEKSRKTYGSLEFPLPYYIFLIAQPAYLEISHPINDYLFRSNNLGCGTICAAKNVAQLPKECSRIITVSKESSQVYDRHTASTRTDFQLDEVNEHDYEHFGMALSPIVSKEGVELSFIPKSCSFYEMLGISSANQLNIGERWAASDCTKSLSVPIGEAEGKRQIFLDLHDGKNGHGAHGLVAGMTGYGKSELLQSIVLSQALCFSPYEVGFLIVDFKGGLASRLEGLPHILGVIKNIGSDYSEIARQLKMIKAEDKRRRLVFDQYNSSHENKIYHIDQYQKLFRNGNVYEPMPHLVIIVDEFAELKAEQPELIKDLVSTARLGRSQGIHLILATQKPAGVIDAQISSNSKFRICMKVEADQDSKDLLKTTDAAHIKNDELGRAFLRVGDEIYEEFQSAYSGAACPSEDEMGLDQLGALMQRITGYCIENDIKKIPNILLPPLQEYVRQPKDFAIDNIRPEIPIGIYDDPENLKQEWYEIPISSSNTLIVGSAQTGKTCFLHGIIRALSAAFSPNEIAIYILDFASMELKKYESLNHVGGVVTSLEEEKVRSLFRMLTGEIKARRKKLFAASTGSYEDYRKIGKTDLPRIVLIIDNLSMLKELYFQDDAELLNLLRDGLSVGITTVATNTHTTGFYKLLPTFACRIALFNNNPSEYMSLFDHCRHTLPNFKGRCLVRKNKQLYDCQLFSAIDPELEIGVDTERFVREQNRRFGVERAKQIPVVPEDLSLEKLIDSCQDIMRTPYNLPLGMDYNTISPLLVDLKRISSLVVGGKEKEHQENYIFCLLQTLQRVYKKQIKFYVLDGVDQPLKKIADLPNTRGYSFLPDAGSMYTAEIEEELKKRYEAIASGETKILENSPLLVLLINNPDSCVYISSNKTAMTAIKNILGKYKNLNVFVLVSQVPNATISFSSPELYRIVAEKKQVLWIGDLQNYKLWALQPTLIHDFKKPYKDGDGYFIKDGDCIRLKLPEILSNTGKPENK